MKNKRLKRRRRITSFLLALLLAGALIYLVADKNQPAKVSADFETITLYGKTYVRTDELPPDAKTKTVFGAAVWDGAYVAGHSYEERQLEDYMVAEYADDRGNMYLWLVKNYRENVLYADKSYDDFAAHDIYICEKK